MCGSDSKQAAQRVRCWQILLQKSLMLPGNSDSVAVMPFRAINAFAIRSERAICRDVEVNLAYRWFCGLSIEDKIPDHSAFSRARHERFRDSDMFRRVFERVVESGIAAGLVGGEGVCSRCEPDRGGRQ